MHRKSNRSELGNVNEFLNKPFNILNTITPANFYDTITISLKEIAAFLQVDNISIFHSFSLKDKPVEYFTSRKETEIGRLEGEKILGLFVKIREFINEKKLLKVGSLDELPDTFQTEKVFLRERDIESFFAFRNVYDTNSKFGIFCFSSQEMDYDKNFISNIQIFSSLLITMITKFGAMTELSSLNQRLKIISDHNYDLEAWVNPDGSLEYISPSCYRITGFTDAEFYSGKIRLEQIVHEEDADRWSIKNGDLLVEGIPNETHFRIIRKDKQIRWMHQAGLKVYNDKGEGIGWRASLRDITELKTRELEVGQANERIKDLNDLLKEENLLLKQKVDDAEVEGIISKDPVMLKLLDKVKQVGRTDSPVLIIGETGTGKELIARAIHNYSCRKQKQLVTLNCSAIPASLMESELFGREKGAYTGALSRQVGRFEVANNSSLFLDEVAELPIETQAKLLRVLQFGEFQLLGSPQTHSVNVRIIAATNKNLQEAIVNGNFREDLFYRINVFPLFIPPLRERKGDIPNLVWHFVAEFSKKMGKQITHISKTNMDKLVAYNWPGNIRELRNVIEYSLIITDGKSLNVEFRESYGNDKLIGSTLQEVEQSHIEKILKKTNWRIKGKNGAAEILGLNESTLRFKIKKLGITRNPDID